MNNKTKFEVYMFDSGWTKLIGLSSTHIIYSNPLFKNFQYGVPYSILVKECRVKPRIKVRQVI